MNKVSITEVDGRWVVTTGDAGRTQRYHCDTLARAQRWATVMGAPRRETMATPLRLRDAKPIEEEELQYTVTWVGPPECAKQR